MYVDDILIASKDFHEVEEMKQQLANRYKIKDLGPVRNFLNIQITPLYDEKSNLCMFEFCQTLYIDEIIKKFHMQNVKPKKTPMIPELKVEAEPVTNEEKMLQEKRDLYFTHYRRTDPNFNLKQEFQSIIGALMYLCVTTRFDIAFAVHQLGRWASDPKWFHFQHACKILKYLKGTRDYRLKINPTDNIIRIYSDADFAGDKTKRKSTSGTFITLGNSPIAWFSKKQPTIAQSTMEAEYIALAHAATQNIIIINQFEAFSFYPPMTYLYCDNSAAISVASGNDTPESKSIQIRWHKVRECIRAKQLILMPIASAENKADIFTKALNAHHHHRHISPFFFNPNYQPLFEHQEFSPPQTPREDYDRRSQSMAIVRRDQFYRPDFVDTSLQIHKRQR